MAIALGTTACTGDRPSFPTLHSPNSDAGSRPLSADAGHTTNESEDTSTGTSSNDGSSDDTLDDPTGEDGSEATSSDSTATDTSAETSGSADSSSATESSDSTGGDTSIDSGPCANQPCVNDGRCVEVGQSYLCDCREGFTGDNCQSNPDDCIGNTCQNGAECVDGLADYTCRCAAGYEGDRCETDIDDCASNPCANGGTCKDGVNEFSCSCVDDFGGPTCDLKLFEPIGFLPSSNESEANAISGNGSVVVGNSPDANGDRAFIWRDGEMAALPSGSNESFASSVNFDGSVAAGGVTESGTRRGAFWYDPFNAAMWLYSLDSRGNTVSAVNDESSTLVGVMVGSCSSDSGGGACRWINFDQDPELLPPSDPFNYNPTFTNATDVSGDGTVIVGYTQSPFRAFRWSEADGWVTLHGIEEEGAPFDPAPFASVISADGSIVFGTTTYDGSTDQYAVRWVGNSGQPEPIGFGRQVTATNADGSVLVIDGSILWTDSDGPRSIMDVLEGLGVDLTEWLSIQLTGISADGQAFSARASRAGSNGTEAAIVRLP